MSKPFEAPALSLAHALGAIRSYDSWRLRQYLAIGSPRRGRIEPLGNASMLHFQDVGYFNRIYDFNASNADQLQSIVELYQTNKEKPYRFGVELVAAHDFDLDSIADQLIAFGFSPSDQTARVGFDLTSSAQEYRAPDSYHSQGIVFRHPTPEEIPAVLDLYLQGFQAPVENRPNAIANMTQLFGHPELTTWCGFHNARPIALCMLYVIHPIAVFAAGVTAPEFQNLGIHEFLIQLRLQYAKSQGCHCVYTWCEQDGQSYKNLMAQGFRLLRSDRTWRLPSQRD